MCSVARERASDQVRCIIINVAAIQALLPLCISTEESHVTERTPIPAWDEPPPHTSTPGSADPFHLVLRIRTRRNCRG